MYINRLTLLKDVVFHVYISLYTRYFVLTFQMFAIYAGEENDFFVSFVYLTGPCLY